MRRLATESTRAAATDLGEVLFGEGIDTDVRDDDGAWAIWVRDDARLDEAREVLEAWRARPDDPRFAAVRSAASRRRAEQERAERRFRLRTQLARDSVVGANGRGWLTRGLLGAALIVAAVGQLGADLERLSPLFLTVQPAAAMLPELRAGQVWRLFTPILVHYGIMHLVFNLWMWWGFAQAVEARKGLPFMAGLVLTAAATSNLGQWAWDLMVDDPWTIGLTGGLSGVLYAVFGYLWAKEVLDPMEGFAVPPQTRVILLGWLFLCMTGALGSVANGAHVVGLLWGGVYALLDIAWFRARKAWIDR